jgi:hypothetical protein
MKDLILAAVAVLAILVIANTDQQETQSGFGGVQVINLTESGPIETIPAYIELNSPNGDWGVSIPESGEKTVYKNGVRLVHLNAETGGDSLRTAVLK